MLPSRVQPHHPLRTFFFLVFRRHHQPRIKAGGGRSRDGTRIRSSHFDGQALHRLEGSEAESQNQEGEVQAVLPVLPLLIGCWEAERSHRLRDGCGKHASLQDSTSLVSLFYLPLLFPLRDPSKWNVLTSVLRF